MGAEVTVAFTDFEAHSGGRGDEHWKQTENLR